MDVKNLSLSHSLLFAIVAAILLGCSSAIGSLGKNIWCFKSSAVFAAISLVSVAISFLPASRGEYHSEIEGRFRENLQKSKNEKDIEGVEHNAKGMAIEIKLRNVLHKTNMFLVWSALSFAVLSIVLFTTGVCL